MDRTQVELTNHTLKYY